MNLPILAICANLDANLHSIASCIVDGALFGYGDFFSILLIGTIAFLIFKFRLPAEFALTIGTILMYGLWATTNFATGITQILFFMSLIVTGFMLVINILPRFMR